MVFVKHVKSWDLPKILKRFLVLIFSFALLMACSLKEVPLPTEEESTDGSENRTSPTFKGLLSAETIGATKIKLSWVSSTSPSVVAYNIYDMTFMFSPKLLKTVPSDTTSITLTGLTPQTYYSFRVRAADKKNKEDTNTVVLSAIPYGGILTAEVTSSSSASLTFNDGSNADAILISCHTLLDPNYSVYLTLSNTTKTTATLSNLIQGQLYTCKASLKIGDFEDNNISEVSFLPMGKATQLAFITQPGSSIAGAPLAPQPVIAIQDANGTVVTAGPDATAMVTLTVSANSLTAGTLRGTASVAAVNGIVTFKDIYLQEAGAKIITATKADTSSVFYGTAPITSDSTSFTIASNSVSPLHSTLSISPEVPPNAPLVANGNASYTVNILLADQFGNPVSGIKPTFISNTSGDILSQATQVTNASGLTTGSISTTVADTSPPYRQLSISSPSGLSSVTSLAPFVPGTPTKLAFTQQPVNSPAGVSGISTLKVAIQDAQGNTVFSGLGSDSSITLTIASNTNNATLLGTVTQTAVNGIASFSDLGIDKTATGYKLIATSAAYTQVYSNSFNITAGAPKKIAIGGATAVISNNCSGAITIQLQDNGNNPANAIQNTPVTITGLGSASLYSSSSCSGTALSTTLTFTSGTNLKTVYLKDLKGESLNILIKDSSNVLTQATRTINISPNKISLIAQILGLPMKVLSGRCSEAIYITPQGEDGSPAPLFNDTTINVTGVIGTQGQLYFDHLCTQIIDPNSLILSPSNAVNNVYSIYFKDPKAEILNISVTDPVGIMVASSNLQTLSVLASNINFQGPSTVISGHCSTAYTITLKDTLGNATPAASDLQLSISGLGSSTTGYFYLNSACTTGPTQSTLSILQNSSSLTVYFKDDAAENLNLSIVDPLSKMTSSQVISVLISPSALQLIAPAPATSETTVCAGPFTINTLDGANQITAAVNPITVDLSGEGLGGGFFSDNACSASLTQFVFAQGESSKSFYFKGQYPELNLEFVATDHANILSDARVNFAVTAAIGFIGTQGTQYDSNGDLLWFSQGVKPVAARVNGMQSVMNLHFDGSKQYLYVVDYGGHKVNKYDYVNKRFIGWIGMRNWQANIGVNGSNLTTPSTAACVATTMGTTLPGWCLGGISAAIGNTAYGGMHNPWSITDDGTSIFVTNNGSHTINRYDAETGAFTGWIGRISTTPTQVGAGGPSSCTTTPSGNVTPGWCKFGATSGPADYSMNGQIYNPQAIVYYGGNLYVGHRAAITRYDATTGTFSGWIGRLRTGSPSPSGGASGCTTLSPGQQTPGWCMGGQSQEYDTRYNLGGVNYPMGLYVKNNVLYATYTNSGGVIATYDVNTGAFLANLPNLNFTWSNPNQFDFDPLNQVFYVADWNRLLRVETNGLISGWIGKVSNNNSMAGSPGCDTLVPNANTPGWCLGGTSKHGMDEGAFNQLRAIAYDGNGHIITGGGDSFPVLKMWNATTGAYEGTLGYHSTSEREWSNDRNSFSQKYGFDDRSMFTPRGIYNDGAYLYVTESDAGRIKKIDKATGATMGWIGGITSSPTGGGTGCIGANAMGPSPTWCLGSWFNPLYIWNYIINQSMDGIMYNPVSITGDSTYLYVVDYGISRIQKFNKSTGAYVGWIGNISTSPIGGATGCVGASSGTFTPGWCTGGTSTGGSGDGMLSNPMAILYANGNLYVLDRSNQRVSSYNATTGAFNGWIGRINTAPTSGCTTRNNGDYTVSASGWCKGGTSTSGVNNEKGGGFNFWTSYSGITTDGTYLYISNSYATQVAKYSFNGDWLGATTPRWENYTKTWSNDPNTVRTWWAGCDYPVSLWADGNYLYGTGYYQCGTGSGESAVWKMDLTTGTMVGWKGAIKSGYSPTAGPGTCAGATGITPDWCQGGLSEIGYKLGEFGFPSGITGDSYYIYITDSDGNRLTRLPK